MDRLESDWHKFMKTRPNTAGTARRRRRFRLETEAIRRVESRNEGIDRTRQIAKIDRACIFGDIAAQEKSRRAKKVMRRARVPLPARLRSTF